MTRPLANQSELEQVHTALRVAVPLDQASPLILATLTTIAHCWRCHVPAHLFGRPAAKPKDQAQSGKQPVNDFKRRASGDFD